MRKANLATKKAQAANTSVLDGIGVGGSQPRVAEGLASEALSCETTPAMSDSNSQTMHQPSVPPSDPETYWKQKAASINSGRVRTLMGPPINSPTTHSYSVAGMKHKFPDDVAGSVQSNPEMIPGHPNKVLMSTSVQLQNVQTREFPIHLPPSFDMNGNLTTMALHNNAIADQLLNSHYQAVTMTPLKSPRMEMGLVSMPMPTEHLEDDEEDIKPKIGALTKKEVKESLGGIVYDEITTILLTTLFSEFPTNGDKKMAKAMAALALENETNLFFCEFYPAGGQAHRGAFSHPALKVILLETFKLLPAPIVFSDQIVPKLVSSFPTMLLAFAGTIIHNVLDCYVENGTYNRKLNLDNKYKCWFKIYTTWINDWVSQ
ncbi:uncharacterized protein EI90DRAFT_3136012 [Cantharellus anzutake]|uniref:uncharacterized protein n=1 Tax=Cantharellus anzutake TaxID=1750568 RepID=UPI001908011A|nr:uncharacterized protein EI90DRAFT_3136012 [Cantharellus anzutake]KAF8314406.1 hypothetical protein EI90DRAFT_3136012 [Cantharellus anzutake]